jgi:hypothetical protein
MKPKPSAPSVSPSRPAEKTGAIIARSTPSTFTTSGAAKLIADRSNPSKNTISPQSPTIKR